MKRTSPVFFYNSQGEILFQRRSANKRLLPNLWDTSASGHIDAGEEPIDTAVRETREEIGIDIRPEDLESLFRHRVYAELPEAGIINNEVIFAYCYKFSGSTDDLTLEPKEVADMRYFSREEFVQGIKSPDEEPNFVVHGDLILKIFDHISNVK